MKSKKQSAPEQTHITILLDRSGSMEDIREATIQGFNTFIAKQRAEPGQATLTLVQFDGQDPYEVVLDARPIGKVPKLTAKTFVPRGNTPLLDAMGQVILKLDERIGKLPKTKRPDGIVVAIITDGQENASREFTSQAIQKLMKEKQAQQWQFVFLSADLAAVEEAVSLGVDRCSTRSYAKTKNGTEQAWEMLSESTAQFRRKKGKIGFAPTETQSGMR